jgi:hypothetical protein
MWRETNVDGVLIAPIVPYALLALAVYLALRPLLVRLRIQRWTWNTPLAETGLYICILSLLVIFL